MRPSRVIAGTAAALAGASQKGYGMVSSTSLFAEALDTWSRAMQQCDIEAARFHTENLRLRGDILAIRPEFRKCFQARCPDVETEQALKVLCQFLACATECRAQAIRTT
jgi:hypothetical protein